MTSTWSDPQLASIAETIRSRTGLTFPASRMQAAAQVLARTMSRFRARNADEFFARLASDPKAQDELLADLTIGETYFFRQPAHFELITRTILPLLPADRPLRMWSAGCATGEEAYSLAITALESGREANVTGTDLSQARLSVARRGRYTDWSMRGVDPEIIRNYFRVTADDDYQLSAPLRNAVEFRYLNLVADRYPALSTGIWGMDVVLCRNVLIYLDRDSVRTVARKLVDTLSEEGWLLLGASDPLISDLVPVDVVVTDSGLCYRRRSSHRPAATGFGEKTDLGSAAAAGGVPPVVEPGLAAAEIRREEPPVTSSEPESESAAVEAPRRQPAEGRSEARPPATAGAEILAEELRRIRALANQGRLADAGIACASALDQHRDSAELMHLHGLLLLSGGQAASAVQAARRALYLDPKLIVAHLLMGDALDRTGDPQGARKAFRRAWSLLAALPAASEVDAADGEPAGRLLRMVETRLALMTESDA